MGPFIADQGVMTLVTVAIIVICAALALYLLYSVTWRAVRRGLREFNAGLAPQQPRTAATHRLARMPRTIRVPNYLPSDWT